MMIAQLYYLILIMKKTFQLPGSFTFLKTFGQIIIFLFVSASSIGQSKPDTTSYVQTVDITTGKIDTVFIAKGDFEAPNWHPGNYLVMNFRGKMYKLDLASKTLTVINTRSIY